MASYLALDSNKLTVNTNLFSTPVGSDRDVTFCRRLMYALNPTGTGFICAPSNASVTRATVNFSLGANTELTGLTHNRRYLIGVIKDTLAVTADKIALFGFDGTRVRETVNSVGKIGAYSKCVYHRKHVYLLDNTNKTVDAYTMGGTRVNTFSITASKTYVGITTDRRNLWLTRSDTTEHAGGTIECWSFNGVQIRKFACPQPTGQETVQPGLTFDRRYKIYPYTLVAPVDLAGDEGG